MLKRAQFHIIESFMTDGSNYLIVLWQLYYYLGQQNLVITLMNSMEERNRILFR